MTPDQPVSKDPMAAAGASTLKVEREGPAVDGVKEVSACIQCSRIRVKEHLLSL